MSTLLIVQYIYMQANKDLALSPGSHTVKHVSITKKRKFEKEQFYTLVYFDPETTGFGKKNSC